MTDEEYSQIVLDQILEIGNRQSESARARMWQIANQGLRFYHIMLRSKVVGITGLVLQSGPFAGMQYLPDAGSSAVIPKLIGSYEAELHETIQAISRRDYKRVVNIGCGEGYYAVGLAMLLPGATVFALDTDSKAQASCRALAAHNAVTDRVNVFGSCTPTLLRELAQPGTLVVCDCEGGELTLLDPAAVPNLTHCDIVVEMHDFLHPNTSSLLEARFRSTHTTRVIPQSARDFRAYPLLESLGEFDRLFALCEFRHGPTPWGVFLSRIIAQGDSREQMADGTRS